jgi:hypothetical protein
MAKSAKFTEQMPFVGTPDQFRLMGLVEERLNDSKAAVIRAGLNLLFDLVDDTLPEGASEEERVTRALAIVRRTEDYQVAARPESLAARYTRERGVDGVPAAADAQVLA